VEDVVSKPNEPLRGPKYRSRAFQEYLLQQTPERVKEILAAESAYNELRHDPGSIAAAAERIMGDTLTGFEDKPAGMTGRLDPLEDPLLPLYRAGSSRE
jgi:hypothetical protein